MMEAAHDARDVSVFPKISADYILAFQFSSWFPLFSSISIRSTIIKPLDQPFKDYLESNGVFVPEGSEDVVAESALSDDSESGCSDESEPNVPHFSFPALDTEIRSAIEKYHAVFPKLNFSSPKDAAWVLPMSSPLRCTSPVDVYLLLKSSDFIAHDLNVEHVFDGCDAEDRPSYELELILRKWYPMDRSREVRCFVRNDILLGITQRDMNFYDYMMDSVTQANIKSAVRRLWEEKIRPNWTSTQPDYIFDLLLTRDFSRGHILDFNPYAPRTDPLLFTYEELHLIYLRAAREHDPSDASLTRDFPELRVVNSSMHPAVARNAPAHQHNMVPIEALSLSEGKSIAEFSDIWKEEITQAMRNEDEGHTTHKFAH